VYESIKREVRRAGFAGRSLLGSSRSAREVSGDGWPRPARVFVCLARQGGFGVSPGDEGVGQELAAGEGLTRPELAVLLAYAKLALHDALLESDVPDDLYLNSELVRYFPQALRERYAPEIAGHKLRREIVAAQLAHPRLNPGRPMLSLSELCAGWKVRTPA